MTSSAQAPAPECMDDPYCLDHVSRSSYLPAMPFFGHYQVSPCLLSVAVIGPYVALWPEVHDIGIIGHNQILFLTLLIYIVNYGNRR